MQDLTTSEPTSNTLHIDRTLRLLGVATAVTVANIYYAQPLLEAIASTLHLSASQAGRIAVATQIGYAIGIFLFVPFGDSHDKRNLLSVQISIAAVAAVLCAWAPNLHVLVVSSVVLGIGAAATHVMVPMSAEISPPEQKGRAVGAVMSGLLIGILGSRVFAGWIASAFGWRSVFVIAAIMNVGLVPVLLKLLPHTHPKERAPYPELLGSTLRLPKELPALRESCTVGALLFASFNCFWTTLPFLLKDSFHRGSGAVGMFGAIGLTGALVAPIAGRLSDRKGPRYTVGWFVFVTLAAYAVLMPASRSLLLLVLGVIVLDAGVQGTQISNQTRIFSLRRGAESRLNTVFMTAYFAGGALGSFSSALVWQHYGWLGVTLLGASYAALALLRHAMGTRRTLPLAVAL
ncbi:MAG TPA: MFS transporter [Terriglobales bacterium]